MSLVIEEVALTNDFIKYEKVASTRPTKNTSVGTSEHLSVYVQFLRRSHFVTGLRESIDRFLTRLREKLRGLVNT
jgi:hypothetical protein